MNRWDGDAFDRWLTNTEVWGGRDDEPSCYYCQSDDCEGGCPEQVAHDEWADEVERRQSCNTCGGTGRWLTTMEDAPTVLVDLGECPDC